MTLQYRPSGGGPEIDKGQTTMVVVCNILPTFGSDAGQSPAREEPRPFVPRTIQAFMIFSLERWLHVYDTSFRWTI